VVLELAASLVDVSEVGDRQFRARFRSQKAKEPSDEGGE
jgi:hypothetical protein